MGRKSRRRSTRVEKQGQKEEPMSMIILTLLIAGDAMLLCEGEPAWD
jgi:hypothetical protein